MTLISRRLTRSSVQLRPRRAGNRQLPAFVGQVNSFCPALPASGWTSFQPAGMSNCAAGTVPGVIAVVSTVSSAACTMPGGRPFADGAAGEAAGGLSCFFFANSPPTSLLPNALAAELTPAPGAVAGGVGRGIPGRGASGARCGAGRGITGGLTGVADHVAAACTLRLRLGRTTTLATEGDAHRRLERVAFEVRGPGGQLLQAVGVGCEKLAHLLLHARVGLIQPHLVGVGCLERLTVGKALDLILREPGIEGEHEVADIAGLRVGAALREGELRQLRIVTGEARVRARLLHVEARRAHLWHFEVSGAEEVPCMAGHCCIFCISACACCCAARRCASSGRRSRDILPLSAQASSGPRDRDG